MKQMKLLAIRCFFARVRAALCVLTLSLAGGILVYAQGPKQEPTASAAPAASGKVMRDYKGIILGMKRDEVRAKMGKIEFKEDGKDRFIIRDDDRLIVYYEGEQVKAIQLYINDAKNAPNWTDVVGNAEIVQMENGAKRARYEVGEENFWVSMYQSKDGAITTITISR
jgi:nitrous oxide reductase accessory protein NosL